MAVADELMPNPKPVVRALAAIVSPLPVVVAEEI